MFCCYYVLTVYLYSSTDVHMHRKKHEHDTYVLVSVSTGFDRYAGFQGWLLSFISSPHTQVHTNTLRALPARSEMLCAVIWAERSCLFSIYMNEDRNSTHWTGVFFTLRLWRSALHHHQNCCWCTKLILRKIFVTWLIDLKSSCWDLSIWWGNTSGLWKD